MKLEICLLEGYDYKIGVPSFPFVLKIYNEKKVEIAEKVDINEVHLKNLSDEEKCFGYSSLVFGIPRDTLFISSNRPYLILCDVFQIEEDVSTFTSGNYELVVQATVFVLVSEGNFERIILNAKRQIKL